MGKQLNFMMDLETESGFCEFLLHDCKVEILIRNRGKLESIAILPKPFTVWGWFTLYLYKESFGILKTEWHSNGNIYLNPSEAPVIEFSRTVVNTDTLTLHRGRIWLEMKYWEDNEKKQKSEELDATYKKIAKWIKKHIPKKEVVIGNLVYEEYASDKIKDLIEKSNYRIM